MLNDTSIFSSRKKIVLRVTIDKPRDTPQMMVKTLDVDDVELNKFIYVSPKVPETFH